MVSSSGQMALNGMCAGPIIAGSPLIIAVLHVGKDLIGHIITGIFVRIFTDGKWDTAFNTLVTSPRFWQLMKVTTTVGSAISAISFLGFYWSERRSPNLEDFRKKFSRS